MPSCRELNHNPDLRSESLKGGRTHVIMWFGLVFEDEMVATMIEIRWNRYSGLFR